MASDEFSRAPLFVLLPARQPLGDLSKYDSSYYARYESIKVAGENQGYSEHALAEENMLRQVLEWLSLYSEAENQKY